MVEGLSPGPTELHTSGFNQVAGPGPRRRRPARRPAGRREPVSHDDRAGGLPLRTGPDRAGTDGAPDRDAGDHRQPATGRASTPAWSAAWSTACPRICHRRPSWASRLVRARAQPHRCGAAPPRPDPAAGARPGPGASPDGSSTPVTCPGASRTSPSSPRASRAACACSPMGALVVVPGDRHDVIMAACLPRSTAPGWPPCSSAPPPNLTPALGSHPDRRRHRPPHPGRRRRQLRDGHPGAGSRPGPAGRRPRTHRGRHQQHRRCPGRVLAGVAVQPLPGRASSVPPPSVTGWSSGPAPPTRVWSCPRAPSPAPCRPRSPAPSGASPAAFCSDRPSRSTALAQQPRAAAARGIAVVDPRAVAERYVAPLALRRHRG